MSDLVQLSVRQFTGAWRLLCAGSPDYRTDTRPGLISEFSGVPIPFFNAVVLSDDAVDASKLHAAAGHGQSFSAGTPWILVVTEECVAPGTDAAATLDAAGFVPVMPLSGMLADSVETRAVPDGLTLSVPTDDAGCESLLDVNSAAYGMPFDVGKPVWGRTAYWQNHVAVLGTVGGEPVSTSAVMSVDGHRYVALVATAPGHQRKGYADAAMRRALELGAQAYGAGPTFLHATEAGRPVYERMGYRTVATHTVYMDKAFLGGH